MTKAFIAGPLFDDAQRRMLEELGAMVEALGIETFLPHRDAGLVEWGGSAPPTAEQIAAIFHKDRDALVGADLVVAWVEGADHDSGTCVEIGMAYARGIPVFALRTDRRPFVNPMVTGVCDEGRALYRSVPALQRGLEAFLAGRTARR